LKCSPKIGQKKAKKIIVEKRLSYKKLS